VALPAPASEALDVSFSSTRGAVDSGLSSSQL